MHLIFHNQWMTYWICERPRANTFISKIIIKSVVRAIKMNFYCFLYQIQIFCAFGIVMIATHRALELQLVFLMLLQNMLLYYVYVWVLVWVLFKLSIIGVSTDWSCTIFSFLNAVCVDFVVVFSLFRNSNDSSKSSITQHPHWNCITKQNHFHQLSEWFWCHCMSINDICCIRSQSESSTIKSWLFFSPFHLLSPFVETEITSVLYISLQSNIIWQKWHGYVW